MHRPFLKRFPLFGVCLRSLRCLISALTGAGGGDLSFRFASSVQSCCGEGGALQTKQRCVWGALTVLRPHWVCPAQGCLCFPVYTARAPGCSIWSGPCVECRSSFPVLHKSADLVAPAFCAFPGLSGSDCQRLGALSPGAARLLPPRPLGSQEVFRQDSGPVCQVGGGGFSGAEFAPFPSPCLLPPAGMGRLFSGVSQSLCFANHRRRVFRPVNFLPCFPTV